MYLSLSYPSRAHFWHIPPPPPEAENPTHAARSYSADVAPTQKSMERERKQMNSRPHESTEGVS